MADSKKGGKNRKYGRNLKSPSAKAYKASNRCEKNAARRAVKVAKLFAKQAAKTMAVPRGTARNLRRKALQEAYAN